MEVKTFWPTKIEKRLLLHPILATQASNFYHGFYKALDIFSPKIKTLSQQRYFLKLKNAIGFSNAVPGVKRVKLYGSDCLSLVRVSHDD